MKKNEISLIGMMVTMVGALLMNVAAFGCGPSDGARKQPSTTGAQNETHEMEPGKVTPAAPGEMHEEPDVPGGPDEPVQNPPGTPEPGTPESDEVNEEPQEEPQS